MTRRMTSRPEPAKALARRLVTIGSSESSATAGWTASSGSASSGTFPLADRIGFVLPK